MDRIPSDIRYARPSTREVWNSWDVHRWVSVAGIYLSAAAMIVLAIANHRTLVATLDRDAEIERQQREFNQGLVVAIEDLAEQTGILTSADFCPVRFRFRSPIGELMANDFLASLTRITLDGDERPIHRTSSMASGLVDFGLLAPGTYRLQVRSADGMLLAHEFDVLPGVPVDRVVICPYRLAPPEIVQAQVTVNWPTELASENVVVLIEILPGPFETGDWRWEPEQEEPPVYVVATTNDDTEWPFERLDHAHLNSVLLANGIPVAEFSGDVQLKHRYWQIGSITFLHLVRDSLAREQLRLLGTVHYESGGPAASSAQPRWEVAGPSPLFEAVPHSSQWNVDIPREHIDELLQRLQETATLPH